MAWQCPRCNWWTADGTKHQCVMDELEQLQIENKQLKKRLLDLEEENHELNKELQQIWDSREGSY